MRPADKNIEEPVLAKIDEYLTQTPLEEKGWESTFESLKSFLFKFIEEDERQIQLKVKFFEKSISDLKKRFSKDISKFQAINMEIWLGQSFEKFGVWDKALTCYGNALNLCDENNHIDLKSETIRNMGHIYMMRNNWDEALESYQQSLFLCQANGDREGEAQALNGLGIIYYEHGNIKDASKYWEKALELAEGTDETKLNAQILTNLGVLMSTQGSWEKALGYYGKAVTLFEQIGEYRGLAETYHNIGMTYADMKSLPDSSSNFEKSYDIAKGMGDVRLQALVKINRIELYLAINDVYAGLALGNQALQTFLQLEDHLGEAETYKFMGALYSRIDKWDLANTYFEQSIFLANKYKNPLLAAEAQFECGIMKKRKGDKKSAGEHLNKAMSLFQSLNAKNDEAKVKEELASLTS